MKILIAYDGSECSDAAIVDLRRAGLPDSAEAVVLTTAEMPVRYAESPFSALIVGHGMAHTEFREELPASDRILREAQELADQAADRLRADFPKWKIITEAWIDDAAAAVVRKAYAWPADLIVLGSHGRSTFKRFLLGSVSQNVLNHAACSVRISRHHLHPQDWPIRLLIGTDGSENAKAAVRAVARRSWPSGTQARVLGVFDSRLKIAAATTLEGTIPAAIEEQCQTCLSKAAYDGAEELAKSGLHAQHALLEGQPGDLLVAEAQKWGADGVFLGARRIRGLDRLLLGSVSSAVATRALRSVEIVRPQGEC